MTSKAKQNIKFQFLSDHERLLKDFFYGDKQTQPVILMKPKQGEIPKKLNMVCSTYQFLRYPDFRVEN